MLHQTSGFPSGGRPEVCVAHRGLRSASRSQLTGVGRTGAQATAFTKAARSARRNRSVGSRLWGTAERSASSSTIRVCGPRLGGCNDPVVSAQRAEGPAAVSPCRKPLSAHQTLWCEPQDHRLVRKLEAVGRAQVTVELGQLALDRRRRQAEAP